MVRPALLLALLAALLLPAPTDAGAETLVEARQRLMVSIVKASKIPRAMAAGEAELDPRAVSQAMKQVLEATSVMGKLFPDGSIDAASTALPAIFTNRVDFEARLLDLEKAAVGLAFAARLGRDELAFANTDYEAVCDGCHKVYRRPD